MAIIAMAREFGLERRHIVVLRDSLRSHANADFMVSKEYFDHALKDAKVSDPKQIQLFDLLFTMWDYKGNNMIHYKDFCIAVSPLACPYDDIDSIINFTLLIGCETMDGKVNAEELHNILECKYAIRCGVCEHCNPSDLLFIAHVGISSVASCLGDEMLDAGDIELVVEAVFECVDEDMLVPHAGMYVLLLLLFAFTTQNPILLFVVCPVFSLRSQFKDKRVYQKVRVWQERAA